MKRKDCLVIATLVLSFLLLATFCISNRQESGNLKNVNQKKDETEEDLVFSEPIESFNINEFKDDIEHFSVNLKYEEIRDSETAKEVAKKLWNDYLFVKYPPSLYTGLDKIKQIKVYYDYTNDCWLVRGFYYSEDDINNGSVIIGGPVSIIKSNGEIIAAWRDR